MRNMIPGFIHEKYKNGEYHGNFNSIAMFMDISGFTNITEKLMTQGKEGAEVLSVMLNGIFIPLINIIYELGGFISSFEGDAFTALFKDCEPVNALTASDKIINLFDRVGLQDTGKFGKFKLSVKIGLAYGNVEWGIVGYDSDKNNEVCKTYFFRGEAVDTCAEAEQLCDKEQVIISKKLHTILDTYNIIIEKVSDKFFIIKETGLKENNINTYRKQNLEPEILKKFFSKTVLEHRLVGEFRDVVSVFISFKEPEDFQELNTLVGVILRNVNTFGAYFEGLNFGDKGGNSLILFGAPISYENNMERAVNFILAVKTVLKDNIRCGITYGKAYSGIKGSHLRSIYGVLGDVINLSARFMMKAGWGEVWITKYIANRIKNGYVIEDAGKHTFKGKSALYKVYKLIEKKSNLKKKQYKSRMIGRNEEYGIIKKMCEDVLTHNFGGVVYIYGNAGIGKSRLLYDVAEDISTDFQIAVLQIDGILKKSMNPFIHFFNNYFKQNNLTNIEEKKSRFNNIFEKLIKELRNYETIERSTISKKNKEDFNKYLNHTKHEKNKQTTSYKPSINHTAYNIKEPNTDNPQAVLVPTNISSKNEQELNNIIKELKRTKWLIGALLGLHQEGSLYEELSAKARFENTLYAIKEFFKALSIIKPIVILIEDLHWMDEDSHKVFKVLTRNIELYPIIIIVSGRFNDDGTKPKLELSKDIRQREIVLTELDNKSVISIIDDYLEYPSEQSLYNFIISKSKGNPFFIEQFCLYLLENELIELVQGKNNTGEKYRMRKKNIELPTSINSVIVSRMDRLSDSLKETVQIASVLGGDFDIKIFTKMLEILRNLISYLSFVIEEEFEMWALTTVIKNEDIGTLLNQGENERLWDTISDKKYSFSHMLLHDVAYDMQSRKRLKNLHRIAAEAIEEIYINDETFYADLAFHNEKAEIRDEAKKYLWKAADYASKNYKNIEAINLYDRLLDYIDSKEEQIKLYHKKGKILDLLGRWTEALEVFNKAVDIAKVSENTRMEAILKVCLGKILQERSNYDDALKLLVEAQTISEAINDKKTLGYSLDNIGEIYRLKGEYDKAQSYFQKSLVIDAEIGDTKGASDSLNNIGNIYRHKNIYDKALECHKKSIEMKKKIKDTDGIALAYNNIAIIHWFKNEPDESLEYFKISLKIKKEMGNKRGICISLNGLGTIYKDKGYFDKALECQQESLSINTELGDKRGIAVSLDAIAVIYSYKHEYAKAVEHHKEALEIKKQIGTMGELGFTYSYLAFAYAKAGMTEDALITALNYIESMETRKDNRNIGRIYLATALVLQNEDCLKNISKDITDKIKSITSLTLTPEAFFEEAIKTSRKYKVYDTLIPALYEYSKYLHKKNPHDERIIEKMKEAKNILESTLMFSELNNIKEVCSKLDIKYNFL